jgi:hypothetical protein
LSISTATTPAPVSRMPRVSDPRPDLDDGLRRLNPGDAHDPPHGVAVDHEVLPELLRGSQIEQLGQVADLRGSEQFRVGLPFDRLRERRRHSAVTGSESQVP